MRIHLTDGARRWTRRFAAGTVLGYLALLACNDGDVAPTSPASMPSVAVQVASEMLSLKPGGTGTVDVIVTRRGGYAGPITLAVGGLPAGLTAKFEPATLPAGESSGRAALVLQSTTSLKSGQYMLDVGTAGSAVANQPSSLNLVVLNP